MRLLLALPLPLALAAAAAHAQAPAATPAASATSAAKPAALPAASDVIARFVAAIGGRDAVMRHNSIRSSGTFEMPSAGVKGQVVLVQAKPDKMSMVMTVPGMGEILTAYDGAAGWAVNPMQGPRLLEGKELDQMREDAGFSNVLRSSESVRSMETVGQVEMGGQSCYKLHIVFKSGRESHDCYSVETGLLVGMVGRQDSPMGAVEVVTLVSDYKDFGGLKSATRLRQQMLGQEQIMTLDKVEFDGAADAAAFDPPAAIKTLLASAGRKPVVTKPVAAKP
jgi:hypothetical protein